MAINFHSRSKNKDIPESFCLFESNNNIYIDNTHHSIVSRHQTLVYGLENGDGMPVF